MIDLCFQHQTIEENPARGYIVDQFNAILDGKPVGYIRTSFLSKKECRRLLPTTWHYMTLHRGWLLNFKYPSELWKKVHLYANRSPASCPNIPPWSLTGQHVPTPEILEQDLLVLEKPYKKQMRQAIQAGGDRPIPEYIKVEEAFQRQGIGTKLYLTMAEFLAKQYYLPLYASGLQTDEAKATWAAMRRAGLPIKWVKVSGKKRLVLDVRAQAK